MALSDIEAHSPTISFVQYLTRFRRTQHHTVSQQPLSLLFHLVQIKLFIMQPVRGEFSGHSV